jgi:heme/copper-type cytochrome/quinol oxidase subunit 3
MGTNKPPMPKVDLLDGWAYFANFLLLVFATVTYTNTKPYGDLPAANWWWLMGAILLVWGAIIGRYIQIRARVKPRWTCPSIREWSEPLQTESGAVVDFWDWYLCSSGLTLKKAEEAMKDPARKHQVEHEYNLYLIAYGEAYSAQP